MEGVDIPMLDLTQELEAELDGLVAEGVAADQPAGHNSSEVMPGVEFDDSQGNFPSVGDNPEM